MGQPGPLPRTRLSEEKIMTAIRIVANNLGSRVQAAIENGETGDYEVIEYLSNNDLIDGWYRDTDKKWIDNANMKAAISQRFEVRP